MIYKIKFLDCKTMIFLNHDDLVFEYILQTKKLIYEHIIYIYTQEVQNYFMTLRYFGNIFGKKNLMKKFLIISEYESKIKKECFH